MMCSVESGSIRCAIRYDYRLFINHCKWRERESSCRYTRQTKRRRWGHHDYEVRLLSWSVQCNSCFYKRESENANTKVRFIDLLSNVLDLFCEEENFWFVEQWKYLMWYYRWEKELQYSMDSCGEDLNKR